MYESLTDKLFTDRNPLWSVVLEDKTWSALMGNEGREEVMDLMEAYIVENQSSTLLKLPLYHYWWCVCTLIHEMRKFLSFYEKVKLFNFPPWQSGRQWAEANLHQWIVRLWIQQNKHLRKTENSKFGWKT